MTRILAGFALAAGLALGLSWPRFPTPPGPFPAPRSTMIETAVPAAVAASRRLAPEIADTALAAVLPAELPAPPRMMHISVQDALAASACLVPFEAGAAYVALWREASVATRIASCRCERRAVHALDGMQTLNGLSDEEVSTSRTTAWASLHALWLRHGPEAGAACLRLFGADPAIADRARVLWGASR